IPAFEGSLNRLLQIFEAVLSPAGILTELIVIATFEKEIGESLHQFLGVDAEIVSVVFGEIYPLHGVSPLLVKLPSLPRPRALLRFRRLALALLRPKNILFSAAEPAQ